MEQVNLTIDPELGVEIKKYIDQGYMITGCSVLKGFKSNPDMYFLSLGEKPASVSLAETTTTQAPAAVSPKVKIKDGEAESSEASEHFHYIKPVVAAHSPDPKKPTLADLVDRIIAAHKKLGLSGKALADRCLTEVLDTKDPVTNTSLSSEVQAAMQAYLNYELSK